MPRFNWSRPRSPASDPTPRAPGGHDLSVGSRGFSLPVALGSIVLGVALAGCEVDLLGELQTGSRRVSETMGRLLTPAAADVDIKAITGYGLTDFTVSAPGIIAVDAGQRRAELARLDTERRNAVCVATGAAPPIRPVTEILGEPGIPPDDDPTTPFAVFMMAKAAAYFAVPDRTEAEAAIATLRQWAQASAMTSIRDYGSDRSNLNSVHVLQRTLAPTLNAWSILRFYPGLSGADREVIDSWLVALVARADVNTGPLDDRDTNPDRYLSQFDSHRYLRDLVAMQWGILSADDFRFRRGIERFFVALRQMRNDGSLPLEIARGGRALSSQNEAIAILVHIAELAAVQGYDLYGYDVDGASIHTAIRFLLDAIDDPRIVLKYSGDGGSLGPTLSASRGTVQNLSFLFARGQRHAMAWIEPYLARFPESANAVRIAALRGGRVVRERPLLSELIGGNATCLYGRESQSLAEIRF